MNEQNKIEENDSVLRPGERPTLKTISRVTGLAIATVSRALHDAPDIGQETKRRVNEVAKQIGYRPNRAGVRLRTGKTNVISLVISTEHEMVNQHTGRLMSSIAGALRDSPYHMIVTPYFPSEDIMDPINYILETGSADAIILNQTEPQDRRVEHLMKVGFPFVTHGRTDWSDKHAYFDFDNYRYAELAIETMAKRGRKNIAVLGPELNQSYAHHLKNGARDCANRFGLSCRQVVGATSDDSADLVESAVLKHLKTHPETDGILTSSTLTCMVAISVFESLGLTVGKEIDIFSKQTDGFLERFRPGILSVVEDVQVTGAFLARAAISRIDEPNAQPMQHLDKPGEVLFGIPSISRRSS